MLAAPHFVGRERELALVQVRIHDTTLGAGGTMLFAGEPGVGKTRFLQECAALKSAALPVALRCGTGIPGGDAVAQLARALRVTGARDDTPAAGTVLRAVAARTSRRTLALFVDDVHRAVAGEARLFAALVAMAAERRCLAIVACSAKRTRRFGDAEMLSLEPLGETAMQLLVRGLMHPGTHAVTEREIMTIVRIAQGNPRYGVELVRACAGGFAPGAPPVAPSAGAAVEALRRSLSKAEFDVLCACSVVGERFAPEWIVDVTNRPRSVVADALQAAGDAGVLIEAAGMPGWLEFRQAAIRAALYATLVGFKRRLLHERTAGRLSQDTAAGEPAARHTLLGEHFEVLQERDAAALAFRSAADAFYDAGDFRAAGESYARAIAHVSAAPRRLELQRLALRCHVKTSDWGAIIPIATDALASINRVSDAETADALLVDLFYAYLNDGNLLQAQNAAHELAALGLPESAARAQIATFILAYTYCYNGRAGDAAAIVATTQPSAIVNWEARLRYLIAHAEAGALREPLEQTYALIDEAAALAEPRAVRGTALCYSTGNEIALRCGDLPSAWTYLERTAAVAERSEGALNDVKLSVVRDRIRTHVVAGELLAARELLRENLEWHASGRHNEALDAGIAVLVGMHTGDLALIDAFFDPLLLYASAAACDVESCGRLLPGFAPVMAVRGLSKELRHVLEQCVEHGLCDAYGDIQLTAIRYAGAAEARRALEQIERYLGIATVPAAAAQIALARATLRRRTGAAGDVARDAARRFRRIGWRLREAVALELAGETAPSTRAYARCGASADVARLSAGQTRKRRRAAFGARLTPRELEVARLVSRKRSNAEIARALGVSVRTVDHQVEAAFSKLGIRARWQLTADLLPSR
jgi:DNA-binding NarL/FixJ family response regulator